MTTLTTAAIESDKRIRLADYHDNIVRLAAKGLTIPEIAKELGHNYHTLHKYISSNSIAVESAAKVANAQAISLGFDDDPLVDIDFNQITFADWYKRWYNAYRKGDIRETTKQKYRSSYIAIKDHPFGEKRLVNITREDVQGYINEYGIGRSKKTVLDHMQNLRSCFGDAVLDGHIKQNPSANVKPIYREQKLSVLELKRLRDRKQWLEADEYQKLRYYLIFSLQQSLREGPILPQSDTSLQFSRQILNLIIFVALKTGARIAEVLGITKDDVLSDTNEINIDKTFNYKKYEDGFFLPTKNVASIRKILVDRETISLINLYVDWLDRNGLVMGFNSLFMLNDTDFYLDALNRHLKNLLKGLDIDPITMHKLRHTQASYLIAKGVPLQVVAKRLGHTNTNMIQRVYGHLLKETEQTGNKMILELI